MFLLKNDSHLIMEEPTRNKSLQTQRSILFIEVLLLESLSEVIYKFETTYEKWQGPKEDILVWAAGGFIYEDGILICPFCELKPRLKGGESPWLLHSECMPMCYFVMNIKIRGWMPNELLTLVQREQDERHEQRKMIEDKHCKTQLSLYDETNPNLRPEMGYKEKTGTNRSARVHPNESMEVELTQKALCRLCEDNISCIAFLPCKHLNCCESCAKKLLHCKICQSPKTGSIACFR